MISNGDLDWIRREVRRERETEADRDPAAKQEMLAEAWRQLAAHPAGEIVLRDLFNAAGLFETPEMPGDTNGTYVRIGRHQMGLHVMQRLRWSVSEALELAAPISPDTIRRLDDLRQFGPGAGDEETAETAP